MRPFFLSILVMFDFLSCSTQVPVKSDVLDIRLPPQSIQYILPDIPQWANFDSFGQCQKERSIHYLDMNRIKESFSLSYKESIELQAFYNQELNSNDSIQFSADNLDRESHAFYNSLGKVQGNVSYVLLPDYNIIYIVWIDQILKNDEILKRLRVLVKSRLFMHGFPIFISKCLDAKSLAQWLEKEKFQDIGAKAISSELFSPFLSNGEKGHGYELELDKFLPKNMEITLFVPKEQTLLPPIWKKLKIQYW